MTLPNPGVCSLSLIDAVVAERQNGRNAVFFASIHQEWRAKVANYIAHHGSPQHVGTWPEILFMTPSFLNLYLAPKEGSSQGRMLSALRAHGLNLCPACGELGSPNTLDHYLPKATYPQFAVTPLNLFPMCDACQRSKGNKTGDSEVPRYFIHPYFDTFSTPQIVVLSIVEPFYAPTFSLAPHPALTAQEAGLVTTHLRELEISKRYTLFFRGEHRRLLKLVKHMRETGQNVLETLKMFRIRAEMASPNSWEHIFYASVLGSVDLCNFLAHHDLPEFL